MKKTLIIILIFTLPVLSYSCEICGCGVGNYYMGILPQFKHRFGGIRYHFNSFNTKLVNDPSQFSKDFFQTVEIWSGWNIGKNFQLLTIVPFHFNHQESDEGITNLNGPGDIALLLHYKLFDASTKTSAGKTVFHQFWIGGGLKLPTGKFDIEETDPDVASAANIQRGSGSIDFMLSSMYNIKINRIAINSSLSYKINSINKQEFRFGNKLTASSFLSYTALSKKISVAPNAGLLFENTNASHLNNSKVDLTGGSLLMGAAGTEISFNKIGIGVNIQLPMTQNFAENQTRSKVKGMAHISFAF